MPNLTRDHYALCSEPLNPGVSLKDKEKEKEKEESVILSFHLESLWDSKYNSTKIDLRSTVDFPWFLCLILLNYENLQI